jgi:hypothetical protein
MDDIVRQAIAKWPNVPHCYGWLGLDARGNWYMRDDRVQAAGAFPVARGAVLRHAKLIEFIHRNYERDDAGCWFFQNGPQRVYVELEAAPWVLRLTAPGGIETHTGREVQVRETVVDEDGRLFAVTDAGLGLVHTLDMHLAAEWGDGGQWRPRPVAAGELPSLYGFVPSPAAQVRRS